MQCSAAGNMAPYDRDRENTKLCSCLVFGSAFSFCLVSLLECLRNVLTYLYPTPIFLFSCIFKHKFAVRSVLPLLGCLMIALYCTAVLLSFFTPPLISQTTESEVHQRFGPKPSTKNLTQTYCPVLPNFCAVKSAKSGLRSPQLPLSRPKQTWGTPVIVSDKMGVFWDLKGSDKFVESSINQPHVSKILPTLLKFDTFMHYGYTEAVEWL